MIETYEFKFLIREIKRNVIRFDNKEVLSGHIIYSIIQFYLTRNKVEDLELARIICRSGINRVGIITKLRKHLKSLGGGETRENEFGEIWNSIFETAKSESRSLRYGKLDSSILLIAAIKKSDPDSYEIKLLNEYNITIEQLLNMKKFEQRLSGQSEEILDSLLDDILGSSGASPFEPEGMKRVKKPGESSLEKYGTCMTKAASEGKFDKVFGRESETDRLQEILCCRKKNNAVLLGDPGVGKSTIVEGLAQRIADGKVPKYLLGKKIYSLNLNSMVSGTMYRGQFEERLQNVIDEVLQNPDIIIFIDEIHNLVGSGNSSGSGDAANILKPYLSKGQFQCIGATTTNEYRRFIEKDGALKRRFQEVFINEPTPEETINILENIKKSYQEYHGVTYSSEVIHRCVELASRYVPDRCFPDKAIDFLDLAGSRTKLSRKESKNFSEKIEKIKKELSVSMEKKKNFIQNCLYEEASKEKEYQDELEEQLRLETKKVDGIKYEISMKTLEEVISGLTGVPIERISKTDTDKLRDLRSKLLERVIGQDMAVSEITRAIQKDLLGLRDPEKPMSLLLIGSTGVGKTLIVKEIADMMYGQENFVRIDCSEYTEKTGIQKLLGSDPGYVGFDTFQSPLLPVKHHPRSVILIDEVDKASPEVINSLFLPILDEGKIKLSDGTPLNFKDCFIIFTGNVGTKELVLHGDGIGFSAADEDKNKRAHDIIMKAVKKDFRPEFINRLSGIIVFNELGREEMEKIYDLELSKFALRLQERGYTLLVSDDIRNKVISEIDLKYGARDLNRKISEIIENNICEKMMETDTSRKKNITVDIKKDQVTVVFKRLAKVAPLEIVEG